MNKLIRDIESFFPEVSRETIQRFHIYLELLISWKHKVNLVAKISTYANLIDRHLLDSLQLIKYIKNKHSLIVDLGSGAGFPGLVLSIAGYNCNLVEISQKKSIFLNEVNIKTSSQANILNCDFKKLKGFKADYLTSRGVASISYLLNNIKNIIDSNCYCLFLKSDKQLSELDELSKQWSFNLQIYKNLFSNGIILELSNLSLWQK